MGGVVSHGGQVGALAQQHIAQAVDHGKLGAAARLNRLGKVGKLRFRLFAVGVYLRGVAYGGTAAAHFLGGVLPQGAHVAGIGASQVLARLGQQGVIAKLAALGVCAVIKIDFASFAGFQIHQNVDDGAAVGNLAHIKRPLVAFQEQVAQHIVDIGEEVHQEPPLVTAVRRRGVDPRQHLHVGAGDIPPRRDRCKAVLPFGQVFAACACFQCKAGSPILAERVDAVGIHACRAAGSPDNIFASNQRKAIGGVLRSRVQTEQAAYRAAIR